MYTVGYFLQSKPTSLAIELSQKKVGFEDYYATIKQINSKNEAFNQSILAKILGAIAFLFTLDSKAVQRRIYTDAEIENKISEINQQIKNITIIQKKWRFGLRKTLSSSKQTFFQWRLQTSYKNRLDDSNSEIQRLKNKNILALIEQKMGSVGKSNKERYICIGRALEIKKIMQDTHYVFSHGQSKNWYIISRLQQLICQIFNPQKDYTYFLPLRLPTDEITTKEEFLSAQPRIHDHDLETRKRLLSVDAYFWNQDPGESALYFFQANFNMRSADPTFILSKFFINSSLNTEIKDRLKEIGQNFKKIGNLVLIAITKNRIKNSKENIVYPSWPYGTPSSCADQDGLDKLQEDKTHSGWNQYRLLIEQVGHNPHEYILPQNAYTKEEVDKLDNELSEIAKKIVTQWKTEAEEELKNYLSKDLKLTSWDEIVTLSKKLFPFNFDPKGQIDDTLLTAYIKSIESKLEASSFWKQDAGKIALLPSILLLKIFDSNSKVLEKCAECESLWDVFKNRTKANMAIIKSMQDQNLVILLNAIKNKKQDLWLQNLITDEIKERLKNNPSSDLKIYLNFYDIKMQEI